MLDDGKMSSSTPDPSSSPNLSFSLFHILRASQARARPPFPTYTLIVSRQFPHQLRLARSLSSEAYILIPSVLIHDARICISFLLSPVHLVDMRVSGVSALKFSYTSENQVWAARPCWRLAMLYLAPNP